MRPRQPLTHSVLPGAPPAIRVRHRRARVHPLEPRPVRPRGPLRVGAVGDVHELLEQLAVADVDRLRDHVRVRVLRDRGVDDPVRVVLRVDVLLDRAAGAAEADGVERQPVGLDEPLLRHDRGLAAEHEVVVRRRPIARGVDHGVALGQGRVVEVAAAADRPLLVPDRDAAVEGVEQPPVPERDVGRGRGVTGRREDRDRVDEAVDRPLLAADHVRDRPAVEQRRLGDVRRERAGRKRQGLAGRRAVEVLDDPVGGAVLAPLAVAERPADPLRVVGERQAEALRDGLADERLLLRAGDDRARDREVAQSQLGVGPAVAEAVAVRGERVRAEREAVDHPGQRPRVGVERQCPRHVVPVDGDRRLRDRHVPRDRHADERVAARDHRRRARQHLEPELVRRVGAGGRGGDQHRRGDRGGEERPPHLLSPLDCRPTGAATLSRAGAATQLSAARARGTTRSRDSRAASRASRAHLLRLDDDERRQLDDRRSAPRGRAAPPARRGRA